MDALSRDQVVITAALTGALTTRKQCEHIPYTPVEIAEEAKRCADAGAAVVHVHAREDDGTPSFKVEKYRQIMDEIRKRSDIIINFSTGAVGPWNTALATSRASGPRSAPSTSAP